MSTELDGDEKFCRRCGHALGKKSVDGKSRLSCSGCGAVVFLDPKLVVVVLAADDGKLVLVRRAIQPAIGRWSLPSGYVDRGEAVEHAAHREVKEETGLDIRLNGLVGLYSRAGSPFVLAAYAAEVAGGTLRAGQEVQETRLFTTDELPPLPFPHDDEIIDDWRDFASGTGRRRGA